MKTTTITILCYNQRMAVPNAYSNAEVPPSQPWKHITCLIDVDSNIPSGMPTFNIFTTIQVF